MAEKKHLAWILDYDLQYQGVRKQEVGSQKVEAKINQLGFAANPANLSEVESQIGKGGSPFFSVVYPIFKFFNLILFFQGSLQYDSNGWVRFYEAPKWRKIVSWILEVCVLIHIVGASKLEQQEMSSYLKLMYEVVTAGYIGYNITFYLALNSNGEKLGMLFRQLQKLEMGLVELGCQVPKTSLTKRISWSLLPVYIFITLSFCSVMRLSLATLFERGWIAFLERNAHTVMLELNLLTGLAEGFNATEQSPLVNALIMAPYAYLSLLYDISWSFGMHMNFQWGVIFIKIFRSFFGVVFTSSERNTLEDIRRYFRITFLIDDFNEIYSKSTAFAILSGSLHFSVYLSTLVAGIDNYILVSVMTALSFTIFWTQLFAMAQVNTAAQKMGKTLKMRYQHVEVWKVQHAQCLETLQGTSIVFNEMMAGSIGFQGWGFFTVSYSFIGSVLSLIATYAIVAIQMTGK